jgi:hypothetical protein
VKSLIQFFDVPKAGDIRLVYNGTSCGLNDALWCPNFWIPTAKSALRVLDYNYQSADLDLGEIFLNFPLHITLQPYSGVDITHYQKELHGSPSTSLRWNRTWMGAKPSPYAAVHYYYLAEEFIRGHHLDRNNPFYWDAVLLNLLGSPQFDPTRPRVMKWDSVHGRIAADLVAYIDDLRASGHSVEACWLIARYISARLQHLGIQDAARKRRPPTTTPGAWAGAVFRTSSDSVSVSIAQDKWDKAKSLIDDIQKQIHTSNNQSVNYKSLEITRGFLCHVSMTFEFITHHLKGFHLTLASYHDKRDSDGWRLSNNEWLAYLEGRVEKKQLAPTELSHLARTDLDPPQTPTKTPDTPPIYNPPERIKAGAHLLNDLTALSQFFELSVPPAVEVRKQKVCLLLYGFADASGGGLGSTVLIPGTGIRYRVGVWGSDESNSSNFREFENVVMTVEEESRNGTLKGALMYLFTDNSTVEGALYKGNTPSKKLFSLIVRLRKTAFENGATIVISHDSGKRMIAQGTDGISCGELNEGVGTGAPMLSFIPLHLSAIESSPSLLLWILSWFGNDAELLSPSDRFVRAHDLVEGNYDDYGYWRYSIKPGKYIWAPPPAAADVALEELRKAVMKRQSATHLFVVPRLLTPEWRRQLNKTADLVFFVEPGSGYWPPDMYEPLTFGFIFPLLSVPPWSRRRTPKLLHMARSLPKMLKTTDVAAGHILCKFCQKNWDLSSLSEPVVRALLFYNG